MLTIIHLSDLHIEVNKPIHKEMITAIQKACQSYPERDELKVIVCTGDIAYSGKVDEYDMATHFFRELMSDELRGAMLIICPGNHDNDFSGDSSVRESVLKDILVSTLPTDSQIDICLHSQKNFLKFKQKIEPLKPYSTSRLSSVYKFEYKGKIIAFNSLNSAYCCYMKNDLGSVFIPEDFFDIDVLEADYRIALIHHTPNWFLQHKQRELRTILNKNYELVISGHEHESDFYSLATIDNMMTEFIEGGMIKQGANGSSFNIIKIDIDSNLIKKIKFNYDEEVKIFRSKEYDWEEIIDTKYSRQYGELEKDFVDFLDDPGAPLTHPNRDKLKLKDVFIFPSLREKKYKESKKILSGIQKISAKKIIQKDIGKAILSGADKAGKTSLAKVIFSELSAFNNIPIYIDCSGLNYGKMRNIDKLLIDTYQREYKNIDIDIFKQSRKKVVVPIMDNFHLASLKNSERLEIITKLCIFHDNFIIFVDDLFLIEELASIEQAQDSIPIKIIPKIPFYTILNFGHALRGELIKKWLNISDSQIDSQDDNARLYDEYTQKLNMVVEYNYVPPLPLYLLTALSIATASNGTDITQSQYGHYYSALITISLARVVFRHEEIDLRINFLTELAYYLFIKKETNISLTEYDDFILNNFSKRFGVKIQSGFKDSLVDANIIQERDGIIYFKYKYLYYYFIANYLSNNLHRVDSVNDIIKSLINSIYKESSSCILMFLINFSKDVYIINSINEYARSIFGGSPLATISDDTEHFNELFSDIQQIFLPDSKPSEARKSKEEFNDTLQQGNDDQYSGNSIVIDEKDPETKSEEFTAMLIAAIKCVNIIGQILKSHYGSLLVEQKNPLFEEAVNISLRALGDFYYHIKENKSLLIRDIEEILKTKRAESGNEIEKIAKRIAIDFSAVLSLSFIRLPAAALGTENLRPIFEDYFKRNNSDNAKQLLRLAMNLEVSARINIEDIKEITKLCSKNVIGLTVLQRLIAYHMYMHKVDYQTMQKINDILKISMDNQRIIGRYADQK